MIINQPKEVKEFHRAFMKGVKLGRLAYKGYAVPKDCTKDKRYTLIMEMYNTIEQYDWIDEVSYAKVGLRNMLDDVLYNMYIEPNNTKRANRFIRNNYWETTEYIYQAFCYLRR